MSKIEEMATTAEYNGTSRKVFEDGFIAGANAVLREIEKEMDLGEPPYLISTEQAYYQVMRKIKELKGE